MRTFTFRSTFLYGEGGGRGCYLEHGEEGDNKTVKIGLRGPVWEVKCSAKQLKQKDICWKGSCRGLWGAVKKRKESGAIQGHCKEES